MSDDFPHATGTGCHPEQAISCEDREGKESSGNQCKPAAPTGKTGQTEAPAGSPEPVGAHYPATGTEARVCDDIARRQRDGIRKYRTTVEQNPLTLRQWLQHAYEEHLDAAVYLRRAIEEIERSTVVCPICGNYFGGHATGALDICCCHSPNHH